jgi:putative transposon-encoded protein
MKKEGEQQIVIKFSGSEIIEREVSKFGTGAHIIVPKEYAGKNVKIIFEEVRK